MPLEEYQSKGGKENGEDQFVTGKAGGCYLAEIGKSLMDFLVQPASCHVPVGKAGQQIDSCQGFGFQSLTSSNPSNSMTQASHLISGILDLRPGTSDLGLVS